MFLKPLFCGGLLAGLLVSFLHGQETAKPLGPAGDSSTSQMELLDDSWELKPGDYVLYEVAEDRAEAPYRLVVTNDGVMRVPLIGSVDAGGKTLRELAFEIKATLEEEFYYRATVLMEQRPEDRNRGNVKVYGEVRRPGDIPIPVDRPLTLSSAILMAGDFTATADRASVSYFPAGDEDERLEIDVGTMIEGGSFEDDPVLSAGDVVVVKLEDEVDRQIYVLGAVRTPGLFTLTSNTKVTISQAVLMAGGFTRFAKSNEVRLLRPNPGGGEPREMLVNLKRVLERGDRTEDVEVQPGDMIVVDERMISFTE